MKTRFIFVRHGQSTGNLSKRFAGQIDVKLTETGIKQGKCTGEYLKNKKIDFFYSSTLSRAYDTACYCAEFHNKPVNKIDDLKEINGGYWEDLTYPQIKETYPQNYNNWVTNIGIAHCDGGESVEDVMNRVYNATKVLAEKHKGKTVLIGTHGMALRAFILKVLNLPLEKMQTDLLWVSNASVTYVDYENGEFNLLEYGYDAHLEKVGLKTELKSKAED
ncbi:MAG: histidine phosphatase family protein [Clostridiales bacterium]|nr:histidine phosphatase family protein [Clostridiales bacterium]